MSDNAESHLISTGQYRYLQDMLFEHSQIVPRMPSAWVSAFADFFLV